MILNVTTSEAEKLRNYNDRFQMAWAYEGASYLEWLQGVVEILGDFIPISEKYKLKVHEVEDIKELGIPRIEDNQ